MKMTQKTIKYLALALAGAIILSIFYSLFSMFLIDNNSDDDIILNNSMLNGYNVRNLKRLNIELKANNLIIKKGAEIKVETTHPRKFYVNQRDESINISGKNLIGKNSTIIIYVPENFVFESIEIEGGAGRISLSDFVTRELSLELGAGEVEINSVEVLDETDIDGGAGEINIINSSLSNLDFDMGIGKCTMNAQLYGKNEIDAGIGQLQIKLLDGKENYTIMAEEGVGNITIDGEKLNNNIKYGNGKSILKINGGIGSIEIE